MSEFRRRVLIVDDDRSVADGLKEVLERYLFHVQVAYTVDDAFMEMVNDLYDVVVVDWILPGRNGQEVIAFAELYFPETTIVVHSAYETTDAACAVSGAHQFVEKGASTGPLCHAVQRGAELAQVRRRERCVGSCQFNQLDRRFIEALERVFDISRPPEGHVGLVSEPRGIPDAMLPWLTGGYAEAPRPIRTLDCRETPADDIEEAFLGRVHVEAGRSPSVKRGMAEQACGGTICLKHVDCLDPAHAVNLAHAAHAGAVRRLGSSRDIPASFRLLVTLEDAEPHRPSIRRLPKELQDVIEDRWVVLPSVNELGDSRTALAQHILNVLSNGRQHIGPAAAFALQQSDPQETLVDLKLCMERVYELRTTGTVEMEDLGVPAVGDAIVQRDGEQRTMKSWNEAREAFATWYFARLLSEAGGNVARAAKLSGLGRQAIYQNMQKYGIDRSQFEPTSSDERPGELHAQGNGSER